MPTVESRAPRRSGRSPRGFFDSGTSTTAAVSASAATGRLIRKIAPHQKWFSMKPPRSGPVAKPRALTAAQMPIARGCSSGAKICITTARVVVMSSAPPTPIPARAAINCPVDWASPAISEPAPNSTSPAISIFLRPYRSAALPAVRSSPDCTSEYALIIHWMSAVLASSSRVREGIATFSTVLSSSTVSWARQMTPRTIQRWGWPWRAWGPGEFGMLYTVEQFLYGVQRRYGGHGEGAVAGWSPPLSGCSGQLLVFCVRS